MKRGTAFLVVVVVAACLTGCTAGPPDLVLQTCSREDRDRIAAQLRYGLPPNEQRRITTAGEKGIRVDVQRLQSPSANLRLLVEIATQTPETVILCVLPPRVVFQTFVGVRQGPSIRLVPFEEVYHVDLYLDAEQAVYGITLLPAKAPFAEGWFYARENLFEIYVVGNTTCVEVSVTVYHELTHVKLRTLGHPEIDQYTNAAERETRVHAEKACSSH